ncbi:MAG: hypothetical protein QG572_1326, partial [Pseudomonadota bacterium]|nr:hypothetical protein [Pseudomonadota bacterium]
MMDDLQRLLEAGCQMLRALSVTLQQVVSHALGRLWADARKAAQRLDQTFKTGRIHKIIRRCARKEAAFFFCCPCDSLSERHLETRREVEARRKPRHALLGNLLSPSYRIIERGSDQIFQH